MTLMSTWPPNDEEPEPWSAHGVRVLVVEDEVRLARLVREALRRDGYQVELAHDGPSGLAHARAGGYDVVLLDLMLPGLSGYEVLRQLRADEIDVPVLVLTAKDGEYDQLDALELGADDYVTKPFSTLILLARLGKLVRRRPTDPFLLAGRLRLEPLRRRAWLDEVEVVLTGREFDVLAYLVSRPGHVVSKQDLLDEVWHEPYGAPNLVEVCVVGVRRKLGPGVVETVRNAGYRIAVERA